MTKREQLQQAIAQLEAQRATLGDGVVDASTAALREKLAALEPLPTPKQRKQATILFAGVSGFAAMSERLDTEEVSDLMNAIWQRWDATIVEHSGLIDKHMGDSLMALWGALEAREDDPEQANVPPLPCGPNWRPLALNGRWIWPYEPGSIPVRCCWARWAPRASCPPSVTRSTWPAG